MIFDYEAMDHNGFIVVDSTSADSLELAQENIRKKGLFVTKIEECKDELRKTNEKTLTVKLDTLLICSLLSFAYGIIVSALIRRLF